MENTLVKLIESGADIKAVSEQNNKYVQKQLEELDKNYMEYLDYWNEKYSRNGFVDVIELQKLG